MQRFPNEYFNKRSGRSIPPFKQNQFGFAVGGPVFLPRLYDGRDKNFFFVDYQGTRWRQGQIYRSTLPTAAQRAGNFSQTFDTQGRLIQIYNPSSTRTNPNNPAQKIRDPFPGNIIPTKLLNPVALKALSFVPQPNTVGDPLTNTNNYISNANRMIDEAELGIKLDQSISSKQRLFERFSFNRNTLGQPDTWGNDATPDTGALGNLRLNNTSAGVSSITTLNASTVLTTSYGFARFYWARPTRSFGFDQSKLGFPSSVVSQQAYPLFPSFNIAGFSNIGGGGAILFTGQNTHSLLASVVKSAGRHTLSFGVDMRLQLFNQVQGGDANGTYSFAQALTAGPNPNSFATFAGSGLASFLLGTPTSGQVGLPAGFSLRGFYYAGYLQDDFHILPKLTLSYGFRYEATSPMDERRNQLNYFDPTLPSPARNAQFPNLAGGLVFASTANRSVYNWTRNGFQPRFGFSYNPFTHSRAWRHGANVHAT